MRIAFYTNSISRHQLPFAQELVKCVGVDNYRYIYTDDAYGMGQEVKVGNAMFLTVDGVPILKAKSDNAREWLENANVLITGHRDLDLIERRCQKNFLTYYAGERWFKPVLMLGTLCLVHGCVRMLVPSYRKMAKRFVTLSKKYACFKLLPYGVWSQRDFVRIGVPKDKMVTWGYFVAPSTDIQRVATNGFKALRVLWVGRNVGWKRVKDIKKACEMVTGVELTIKTGIPIEQVRQEMQKNDVYVLASNAEEGWGAALSEALEEGMVGVGTHEAGSSATMLEERYLYHAGKPRELARILERLRDEKTKGTIESQGIGEWSAQKGVGRFLKMLKEEGLK